MKPEEQGLSKAFLKNPQQTGAWCLRVKLSGQAMTMFQSILNIEPYYFSPRGLKSRGRLPYDDYPTDLPPIILVRLFAYLKGYLPSSTKRELPDLISRPDDESLRKQRAWLGGRVDYALREMAKPPTRVSPNKRAALSKASKLFLKSFAHFRCTTVPDNLGKLDFRDSSGQAYFQAAQEPQGILKVFSLDEQLLGKLRDLILSIPKVKLQCEIIRTFSPESTLMELYVPVILILHADKLLTDVTTIKNVAQVLDEIREERFVHAIRATGIAVEELLVETYETCTHEKAPAAPLGELLTSLNSRLKELVSGTQKKSEPNYSEAKKNLGQFMEKEKKQVHPNQAALGLAQTLQKSVIPLIEKLGESVNEAFRSNSKETRVALFPSYVQRCIGELVNLRNRVSHRVERATSVTNVEYVEAALALRAYIVLATWWQEERSLISYKQSRKKIIADTIQRSAQQNEEPDSGDFAKE